MINQARAWIESIVREAEVGQVYDAKVKRIEKIRCVCGTVPR